jgi:hypothetical protein
MLKGLGKEVCQLCRKVARVMASHICGKGRGDRQGMESYILVKRILLCHCSNISPIQYSVSSLLKMEMIV